jgi:hypothetical protein
MIYKMFSIETAHKFDRARLTSSVLDNSVIMKYFDGNTYSGLWGDVGEIHEMFASDRGLVVGVVECRPISITKHNDCVVAEFYSGTNTIRFWMDKEAAPMAIMPPPISRAPTVVTHDVAGPLSVTINKSKIDMSWRSNVTGEIYRGVMRPPNGYPISFEKIVETVSWYPISTEFGCDVMWFIFSFSIDGTCGSMRCLLKKQTPGY